MISDRYRRWGRMSHISYTVVWWRPWRKHGLSVHLGEVLHRLDGLVLEIIRGTACICRSMKSTRCSHRWLRYSKRPTWVFWPWVKTHRAISDGISWIFEHPHTHMGSLQATWSTASVLHQSHHLLQGVTHARKKLHVRLDIWHRLTTVKPLHRKTKLVFLSTFQGIRHGANHRSKQGSTASPSVEKNPPNHHGDREDEPWAKTKTPRSRSGFRNRS